MSCYFIPHQSAVSQPSYFSLDYLLMSNKTHRAYSNVCTVGREIATHTLSFISFHVYHKSNPFLMSVLV